MDVFGERLLHLDGPGVKRCHWNCKCLGLNFRSQMRQPSILRSDPWTGLLFTLWTSWSRTGGCRTKWTSLFLFMGFPSKGPDAVSAAWALLPRCSCVRFNMNYGDSLEKPRVGEGLHAFMVPVRSKIESKRDLGNCGCSVPALGKTGWGPGPSAVT